ncbi:hypothetical protein COCSADRAFT_37121 [Bipolaris sorokiniana ND90Pr]|uniref:Uncharacterized protein n=1 Tax=Cochliobolus sativus (strain ND90Pr / ATCC 201652) TaxID=665912 RepID=M2T6G2_COCSN|nr:uncharacterized protein COCSADRAFT_37121 [Bipolaris sorokiniana ND90Pr]EMD64552.1 hypothetical protein COCSADRAFT_37121 [Bipolaris sorokiniana ND90Pr]
MRTTTFLMTLVLLTPTVFARCLLIGPGNGQICFLTVSTLLTYYLVRVNCSL